MNTRAVGVPVENPHAEPTELPSIATAIEFEEESSAQEIRAKVYGNPPAFQVITCPEVITMTLPLVEYCGPISVVVVTVVGLAE